MRRLACLVLLSAIAAPALAQQAGPQIDWTKPQIVDPPLPFQPPINEYVADEARAIEVTPLLTGDRWRSVCTFARSLAVAPDADAQTLYEQCVREAQNTGAEPKVTAPEAEPDPRLRNFSPEMRAKLRPFLPPQ